MPSSMLLKHLFSSPAKSSLPRKKVHFCHQIPTRRSRVPVLNERSYITLLHVQSIIGKSRTSILLYEYTFFSWQTLPTNTNSQHSIPLPQGYVPISNQKIWLTLYFDKKKQVPTKWLNWRHLLSTNKSLEISLEPSMTYCKQLTSLSFVDT